MAHPTIHALSRASSLSAGTTNLEPSGQDLRPPDLRAMVDGKPGDEVILVHTGFEDWGRERAIRSGSLTPQPMVLAALRGMALAEADKLSAAPYDPDGNSSDANMRDRNDADLKRSTEHELRVERAAQVTDDKRAARAALGEEPRAPKATWTLVVGTVATAVPVGMAMYQGVTTRLLSPGAAGPAAAAGALLFAALPVSTLVRSAFVESPDVAALRKLWLGICTGVSVLVYLAAASPARAIGDHILALSYGLGAGLCLLMTALYTYGLARSVTRYRERLTVWMAATQAIQAAERRETEQREALASCHDRIAEHDKQVRTREHHRRLAVLVRRAADQAVYAGYMAGIAENRGEGGASVRPPTTREVRELTGSPQSTPA